MRNIILTILIFSFLSSCYYDNEEVLYPNNGRCDTTNVTYTNTIQPIMDVNCVSCHNSGNALGGVDLSSYSLVRSSAENGSLYGTVAYQSGYSQMPKGGNKLSDCNLNKIQAWINNGYLN